jgi:LysM repeat protein
MAGVCQGDSGGPLVLRGELVGIASAVTNNCQGQTLWTSVAGNQEWILNAIQQSGVPFDGPTRSPSVPDAGTPEPEDVVFPGHRAYVIRAGDTLEAIASRMGVTLDQIVQFNRGRRFDVGTTLSIPPPSVQPPVQPQPQPPLQTQRPVQPQPPFQTQRPFQPQPPVEPRPGRIHIVRPGDTFYSLARLYYPGQSAAVAANRIIAANGGRQSLSVGQQVVIP